MGALNFYPFVFNIHNNFAITIAKIAGITEFGTTRTCTALRTYGLVTSTMTLFKVGSFLRTWAVADACSVLIVVCDLRTGLNS